MSTQLAAAIEAIIPLGSNGLIDELWSLCRRTGDHRLAEEITRTSNAVRAALYDAQHCQCASTDRGTDWCGPCLGQNQTAPEKETEMTTPCTIVSKQGPLYPDGHSTVYELRAGALGTGRLLASHEARGDYRAHDQARDGLRAAATVAGIARRYHLIESN